VFTAPANNWPPLPKFVPWQPCFYHDIHVEIPPEFQTVVGAAYRLWMCELVNDNYACAHLLCSVHRHVIGEHIWHGSVLVDRWLRRFRHVHVVAVADCHIHTMLIPLLVSSVVQGIQVRIRFHVLGSQLVAKLIKHNMMSPANTFQIR
jgi:hypothetical protein